ncbi:MAG: hypothetical protein GXP40_05810 [Chloroflexi bacterium]|nr:hypothetical protein [Chloroflexota bacterium]
MKTKRWTLVLLLFLVAILITACNGPDEHVWLKSPGWSRAVFLGNTAFNDPVPITLDDEGRVYFVLLEKDEDASTAHFRVMAFDRDASPLWQRVLADLPLHQPDSTQMVWDGRGLRLFWIEQEQLYTLKLQPDGAPLGDPVLLSGDAVVGSYSLTIDSSGGLTLWYAGTRRTPGIYALTSSDGSGSVTRMDPDGIRIQLRHDQRDTLHASWVQYPMGYGTTRIFYASYPAGTEILPGEQIAVHSLAVGPSSSLAGPTLGVDATDAYLFWTVTVRSGLEAGAIETEYLHFPLSQPSAGMRPQRIAVPSIYALDYAYLPNSRLDVGERVSLQNSSVAMTTELQEIAPNPVPTDELAIAFRSPTQYLWRKVRFQVNVAYLSGGRPSSYQPLSFTASLSTAPNLVSSDEQHLYLTWLEKQETDWYTVYFASTSPEIEAAFSHTTRRELARLGAQVSFGMLVGVLLAPIAAGAWIVAPLFVLLLMAPLRKMGSDRVQTVSSIVSLAFAVAAYWAGKLATLPGMMDYVPFSAWIPDIPTTLGMALRWGVPVLITILALWGAWYYTFRQANRSTLYFLLAYVGIDAVMTTAIYAVLIYGAG